MKTVQIIAANTIEHLQSIEKLAWQIIPEFYVAYIPLEHCIFFVKKFQTVEAMLDQVSNGFEYYLLIHADNEAGYVGIQLQTGKIILSKLYLLKQYRGTGIGTVAMKFIHERAAESGASTIELEVNPQNTATIKFYEQHGFAITQSILHEYENGVSIQDYKMIKHL